MQSLRAAHTYSTRERALIAGVVVLVAIVHLASFLYLSGLSAHNPKASPYPIVAADSSYYTRLADNLLTHHVYSDSADLSPAHAVAPGYPFFLAVVKGLMGSFTPASLLQTLLALFSVALIYAIGRRYLPVWLALLAALVYGIEPMVVFVDTTILTDGLFSSLLVIIVYLGFFQSRLRGVSRAAVLGLLLGIAAMIRPTGEYLIIVLPVLYAIREWMRGREEREERHPDMAFLVYVLCAALVILPWVVRNHGLFGIYEIEHEGPSVLLDYHVRDFLAWREMGSANPAAVFYPARHQSDPVFMIVDKEIAAARTSVTPAGEDPEKYNGTIAMGFILADPFRFAYFDLMHLAPFFLGGSIATYEQIVHQERDNTGFSTSTMYTAQAAFGNLRNPELREGALLLLAPIVLEVVWWLFVLTFAVAGLFFERRRYEVWLFSALVGYFALITGSLAIARYRIPTEPYLFLLAALGVYAVSSRVRAKFRTIERGHAQAAKVFRYLISGGTTFLVSLGIYSLLVYGAGMWYIPASVAAFLLAFIVSFVLQKFFTFRDPSPPRQGQQILGYLLVLLFNMCANTFILFVLVEYLGAGRLAGLVVSNIVIAVWNFFIYERFLFAGVAVQPARAGHTAHDSLSDMSVVIPCHNEEDSIASVLDTVPAGVREIIVVDNNSTDETARIAAARGARVIAESRQGYGAAAKRGFASADGSILAIIDGDNQHPAEELPRIMSMLIERDLDFISTSRFPLPHRAPMSILRRAGNWGLTLAANILFGIALTDSQCGMVVFKKTLLSRIEPTSDDVVFVQELKIRAARDPAIQFAEYHIPCLPRVTGVSKVSPIRHGVKLLYALIALRLRG